MKNTSKTLLVALLLAASTQLSAASSEVKTVIETGTTVASSYASSNQGPFGLDFEKFVSTSPEQYLRIGWVGGTKMPNTDLEMGFEGRTRSGDTSEYGFYGRAIIGSGSLKGFFGGSFGWGKDTAVEGQAITVNVSTLLGGAIAAGAHTTSSPKYTTAGGEAGIIYEVSKNFHIVAKGEVQTKSYDLGLTMDDPNLQSTLAPMSWFDVEEAKRFETEIMDYRASLALRVVF